MKKAHIVILSAILCILVFNIVKANSFDIALQYAHLNTKNIEVFHHGFNLNECEFKIIKTSSATQNIVLAHMAKNRLGFWTCISANGFSGSGIAFISWFEKTSLRKFSFCDNYEFEFGFNSLYYGNNAIKYIDFQKGDIPERVAVNIFQAGNEYSVHLITFEDKILNGFNIQEALLNTESISIQEAYP